MTASLSGPATTSASAIARSLSGEEAAMLLQQFPPRPRPSTWPAGTEPREAVLDRLRRPPLKSPSATTQNVRITGARAVMRWLESAPGASWQQRWDAIGAESMGPGWADQARSWSVCIGRRPETGGLKAGLLILVCADVIRPSLAWFVENSSRFWLPAMEATRDPAGFAALRASLPEGVRDLPTTTDALRSIAQLLGAYGGMVEDLTAGEMMAMALMPRRGLGQSVRLAYSWLHARGQFPPGAPATLLRFGRHSGQVSVADLVDRYDLRCQPVRNLIIDYLQERRPSLDYNTIKQLSAILAGVFWADLERHHPGIDSLRLPPEVAEAWKTRVQVKTVRERRPDGTTIESLAPRLQAAQVKLMVRAFYLDLARWAMDEPERWGVWVAPSPVSEAECAIKKTALARKSRMHQRTRERLPVLPVLVRVAARRMKEAAQRLEAMENAELGSRFTVLDETFVMPRTTRGRPSIVRDTQGRRRDLRGEERRTFWAWATIEILRHTGIRVEELLELGHHSIISYRLPSNGDIVPLLQIAPSKTDQERLLLVSPELADVLSAVVTRVRGADGRVPLVTSYDWAERVRNPPMPLLFQWTALTEPRPIGRGALRLALDDALLASGLTDHAGQPLRFQPHDFRRIFITDAILNGLPPHIAQVIAGHEALTTTMGYAALYPADAIEAHRAFIARRRNLRPAEEYRAVTPQEWQEFLGHFEKRKLSLGECGRAYGTDCAHEHACVRCPVLILSPAERPRLIEIRDNLNARITEAEQQGWLGEVQGLSVSLAAAEDKIGQIDTQQERRTSPIFLGVPSLNQLTARTPTATATTR
jgi:hypothetical protein